jgi:hypothetical protein
MLAFYSDIQTHMDFTVQLSLTTTTSMMIGMDMGTGTTSTFVVMMCCTVMEQD